MPTGSYNAELVKQLTPEMQAKLDNILPGGGDGGGGGAVGPLVAGISAFLGWWKRRKQR